MHACLVNCEAFTVQAVGGLRLRVRHKGPCNNATDILLYHAAHCGVSIADDALGFLISDLFYCRFNDRCI